jgi:hypothetical protein
MSILAPIIGAFQMGPRKQNADFLENGSSSFEYILAIYVNHLPKYEFTDHIFRIYQVTNTFVSKLT